MSIESDKWVGGRWGRLVVELAKQSQFPDKAKRMAAILVCKAGVFSATNTTKTHPRNLEWRKDTTTSAGRERFATHAECGAIIKALSKTGHIEKGEIYVARVNKTGETRMAKPCRDCQDVLDKMNVKVRFYTV